MAYKSFPDFQNPQDDEETSEQPKGSSRTVQWLIVLSLAILFIPLYLVSTLIKDDIPPLQTQAADIGTKLSVTTGPNPTEKLLKSTLTQLQSQVNALDLAGTTLVPKWLDWPDVMAVVGSYDQTRVVLVGLAQTDRIITLQGQANDENAVMEYAQKLKDSNLFVRVVVEGITIKPSPTITPSPTPTTTPSPTATRIPGTKASGTAIPARILAPTGTPTFSVDAELRDKFAIFTILLEARAFVVATATHS